MWQDFKINILGSLSFDIQFLRPVNTIMMETSTRQETWVALTPGQETWLLENLTPMEGRLTFDRCTNPKEEKGFGFWIVLRK